MERIKGEKRKSAKNDSISCDLGLRYPSLQSIAVKPGQFLPDPDYVVPPSLSDNVVQDDGCAPGQDYVAYAFSTANPVLQWLPTKLAEWIGSNLCYELGIPPKRGSLWTASKLNAVITGNIVGGPV